MASYNNEDSLAACLNSVKGWTDEIIIVDGYSTDKTVEIAKKYGAKVILRENNPIFHVQKQIANSMAKSDWVLQMDTDEIVSEEMKKEILSLLSGSYFGYDSWVSPVKKILGQKPNKLKKIATAYWLPRKNFFLGRYLKHTGQYPDPVIRLFQKGKAFLPAKSVHEQMTVNGEVGWLKSDLIHMATPNFTRYLLREDRYSSLTAKELQQNSVKINPWNTLKYLFLLPLSTFLRLYIRYQGVLDGFPGFVFSLYSGLHFAFAYMKLWENLSREDLALK